MASKPQEEGCWGRDKKNSSIVPNGRQRLSEMEAEIRTDTGSGNQEFPCNLQEKSNRVMGIEVKVTKSC